MYKSQSGFTLIELVVVIVILGILAVTAAPRFVDLTSDANIAALKGVAASIESSNSLVYAKSQVNGIASAKNGELDLDNDGEVDIDTIYGHPSADRTRGIPKVLDFGSEGWSYSDKFGGTELYITSSRFSGISRMTTNNIEIRSHNCYLTYIPPKSVGGTITITYTTTGC